jgi:hypothetical protein
MTLRLIQSIDYRLARLEELADWLAYEIELEPDLADGEAWLEELHEVIDGLKLEKQQYS